MKIDQTTGSLPPLRPGVGQRPATARAVQDAPATPAASSNVRTLPAISDDTFDAEKVAAIREDIRSGRYKVNAERVADGMLASIHEMLSSGQ